MEVVNGGSSANTQYGVEKLVGTNYKYWRMCMEAYLQGQDLWELIVGVDTEIPDDTLDNTEPRRKWKIKCGKALFALRTSISKEFIDHVRDVNSPKDVWNTLERLFSKKNTARLQFLENELAMTKQEGMSISEYFLKIKNICAEISELDPNEKISEARLRRFLIRGLQKEYIPYITSVQGWETQPSVEELESLLSNQEALAKQMAKSFNSEQDAVLFSRGKLYENNSEEDSNGKKALNNNFQSSRFIKCYRCGKPGHIKRNCRTKLSRANVACEDNIESDQLNWEQCFTTTIAEESDNVTLESTSNQAQINYADYKDEWIIDSGCSHHVTGDDSLFLEMRQHNGKRVVVTADNSMYPVAKEGAVKIDVDEASVKLDDVYHVPGLKKNLISVSQITNSGKYVLFGPHDVKVLDNFKNVVADVVLSGEKKGSLFVMSVGEAYVKKASQTESAATWHARLGHVGYQMLQQISSKKLLDGLPLLNNVHEDVVCQGCQYGKSHHLPFKSSSNRRTTPLELIHTDLMGPTKTPSCSNCHYVMILVDDYSRYTWSYFLKEKNEALSKFIEFRNMVEKELGKKVKCLRSDNGGEFMSADFFQYCDNNSIQRQMTCPNTPQQNGVAERKLAHLISMSLSWLHDKNLPRELWAEAVRCACYVINRLPPWPGKEKAPFEMLYGVKPNVNYFRVFGSICYVHVPKNSRTKLDAKAKKCVFVGYDTCRKGWRCMDPTTKKSVTSRDVVFDEISSWHSSEDISKVADLPNNSGNWQLSSQTNEQVPDNVESENQRSDESPTPRREDDDVVVRRSSREKRQPVHLKDYEMELNHCSITSCFLVGASNEEPECFEEAKGCLEWEAAMGDEIEALRRNDTWELVPKPKTCKPVTCKWVYRLKKKPDGTIDRYKARLVARGFSQSYGLDYEETFSPVAKMVTVRSIFSLASFKSWKIWQLDVKNAFLYGELDREVLMEQPPGFVSKEFPHHVCLLKKALYGLKQAPRAWYGKVAQYFIFCGFTVADSDSSLFVKTESKGHLLVLLYVDDMLITGENEAEISRLRNDLSIRFEMKNLGEIGCFLGLEVKKTCQGFFISQKSYAKNLLERFGMGESNGIATPMEPYLKLNKEEGELLKDERRFRQLVGSLIYLTTTRPEIAFPVSIISQFMQSPRTPHLDAAKRILRYVKYSLDYGLLYKRSSDFMLRGYTDADWAGDTNDRRSTSSYCFSTGSAMISWCSKKQSTVALSSTEAEYMAATIATQECIWLKRLIGDIYCEVDYAVPIECDNESAIRLASNPIFHGRTKHIEIHHHFVREKVLNQEVELKGVHTSNQVADIFTKALAKSKFESFRAALGVVNSKYALRGSLEN